MDNQSPRIKYATLRRWAKVSGAMAVVVSIGYAVGLYLRWKDFISAESLSVARWVFFAAVVLASIIGNAMLARKRDLDEKARSQPPSWENRKN